MMNPADRRELFGNVFNNEMGQAVLEYLEALYDVGCKPESPDKEYIKTCKRSVIKQIRAFCGNITKKE